MIKFVYPSSGHWRNLIVALGLDPFRVMKGSELTFGDEAIATVTLKVIITREELVELIGSAEEDG